MGGKQPWQRLDLLFYYTQIIIIIGIVMNKLILIYDDDVEILLLCKIILERQNYRVETKTHCDDIINDISSLKPGLILMDIWIPEIGGENATNLMKTNDATKHVPVILFSANPGIEEIFKRTDANGYLRKPFDVTHMLELIGHHILAGSKTN